MPNKTKTKIKIEWPEEDTEQIPEHTEQIEEHENICVLQCLPNFLQDFKTSIIECTNLILYKDPVELQSVWFNLNTAVKMFVVVNYKNSFRHRALSYHLCEKYNILYDIKYNHRYIFKKIDKYISLYINDLIEF